MADRDPVPLPAEVRAKLAELELELSEGEYLGFTAELGGSLPGSAAAAAAAALSCCSVDGLVFRSVELLLPQVQVQLCRETV